LACLSQVPCLLTEASDERSAILALVENLQRQDLGFFEEAEAIARLMQTYSLTQEQAAKSLGMAASTLSNKLRLMKLPPALREEISAAGLTERHARALLRIADPHMQSDVLQRVIQRDYNVQETDALVDSALAALEEPPAKRSYIRIVKDVRIFVNSIHHAVDAMRNSGIQAVSEKTENDEFLIYTVRIPKDSSALKPPCGEQALRGA